MEQRSKRIGLGAAFAALLLALGLWWSQRERSDAASGAADQAAASQGSQSRLARIGAGEASGVPRLALNLNERASIAGTVRDPAGQPIAAAQVCALPSNDALAGFDRVTPKCSRSEADGSYRIEGLWPVRTAVHASAATFLPSQWSLARERGLPQTEVALVSGQSREGIDITLEPGGAPLRGVVKDISGGVIEGALVQASSDEFSSLAALAIAATGEDGSFELWTKPGTIAVSAQVEGYASGSAEATAPGEFVELFLTPESVLVGQVVDATTREPVPNVMVVAGRSFGSFDLVDRETRARSDENGEFRIAGLEPGIYKPEVYGEALFGKAETQVHLGLGETSAVVLVRAYPASSLRGQVVIAGSGEPCPSGEVSLIPDDEPPHRRSIVDGVVDFRGLLPGSYSVAVSCEGYLSAASYPALTIGAEPPAEQIWEVRAGLSLSGRVVDEAGAGIFGVSVVGDQLSVEDKAVGQGIRAVARSQDDGSFTLTGLLAGSYELDVTGWFSDLDGLDEPLSVEFAPGREPDDLRIVMPALGQLEGRVVDQNGRPIAGAELDAVPLEGATFGSAMARSDDEGRFRMPSLRTGRTLVTASTDRWGGTTMRAPGTSEDDAQGREVEILADRVTQLELVVERRDGVIRGRVTDEGGGAVADAFVEAERMSERAGASSTWDKRALRWSVDRKPVLTSQDGEFELGDLPEGRFIVRAYRKGGGEAIAEGVALGERAELVIAATGSLAGTVRLKGGASPERVSVTVTDRSQGLSRGDSFFRTDGVWSLGELPPGRYEITAQTAAATGELKAVELAEGQALDKLDLELAGPVTLRGRLVEAVTREPVAGMTVIVEPRGEGLSFRRADPRQQQRQISDAEGRFEIADAPTGKVTLFAYRRGGDQDSKYQYGSFARTIASEPAVQDLGELELVAERLEPEQRSGDIGFTLADGDPAAEPEAQELVVALVRPGGPAEGSGLEVGDVIETVDGLEVAGEQTSRWSSLTRVPEGRTLEFGVRGGKTVEITAGLPR